MKIVYIARKFLEGFAYQDNELANMHAHMGHQVTVITSKSDDSSLYFDMSLIKDTKKLQPASPAPYRVIYLPLKHKVDQRFWQFKEIARQLEELSPDLIFFHGAPMLVLLDLARYKRKHLEVKLVMDCHNDYNNAAHGFISRVIMHKFIYRSIIRRTSREVDLYYYLAPNIKLFMQEMYRIPETKLRFLPRGGVVEYMPVEQAAERRSRIRREWGITEHDFVVVNGGKLDAKKRTLDLVEAIKAMGKPDLHLILFGSIDKSYEAPLLKAIGEDTHIHLTGWIDSKKVYDYFFAADAGCFPGGHSVLWEQAICCGLPLIVKNWFGGMHYLDRGGHVILMPDADRHQIIESLTELYNSPVRLMQMRRNAIEKGREFFSYRRIAQSIIDNLKEVPL